MIGAPSDNLGRAGKVSDGLLDKISELRSKRDRALAQLSDLESALDSDEYNRDGVLIISAKRLHEMLDDIQLNLL